MNPDDIKLKATASWETDPEDLSVDQARMEIQRLQRTILVIIAAGFITSDKAEKAYEIAGWK